MNIENIKKYTKFKGNSLIIEESFPGWVSD